MSGSILYGHSDGFSQCFSPLGCPNHVRPERSLWELVPGVPRSLTPHPSIKRVSIWCYTKLCGYKQGSRNGWNHTVRQIDHQSRFQRLHQYSIGAPLNQIRFIKTNNSQTQILKLFSSGICKLLIWESVDIRALIYEHPDLQSSHG